MSLAGELKTHIYRFALQEHSPIQVDFGTTRLDEPGILKTCREIRKDAIKIYYEVIPIAFKPQAPSSPLTLMVQENIFQFKIRSFDASRLIAWSQVSKLRANAIQQILVETPRRCRPWENLLVWLKAFYHGACPGMFEVEETTGWADARQMFHVVEKMFQIVTAMRRRDTVRDGEARDWMTVMKVLNEVHEIASTLDERWK